MENVEETKNIEFELSLSHQAILFLSEIRKWSKFLAIVGFIGIGFLIVIAALVGIVGNFLPQTEELSSEFGGVGLGILSLVYVVMAIVNFFPVYYLYKFASELKIALNSKDKAKLTESFGFMKSLYKFMGIFAIIILSIYALIFVFGVLFSSFM